MEERIEKIEKQMEAILLAYEQNKLFIDSYNETLGAANLLLKIMPEFMTTVKERLDLLEQTIVDLQNNQLIHSGAIEAIDRNIKHIVDIIT